MTFTKITGADERLLVPSVMQAVCAGFPSPADDYLETLDLSALLIGNPPATFLWRVEGNSMIDEGIHPHDFVLVDRSLKQRKRHPIAGVPLPITTVRARI